MDRRMASRFRAGLPLVAGLVVTVQCLAQAPIDVGVKVSNVSSAAVVRVYAKPDGLPSWTPVQGAGIAARSTKLVKIPSETNCQYDLRFVFTGGRSEEHQVDICKHIALEIGNLR